MFSILGNDDIDDTFNIKHPGITLVYFRGPPGPFDDVFKEAASKKHNYEIGAYQFMVVETTSVIVNKAKNAGINLTPPKVILYTNGKPFANIKLTTNLLSFVQTLKHVITQEIPSITNAPPYSKIQQSQRKPTTPGIRGRALDSNNIYDANNTDFNVEMSSWDYLVPYNMPWKVDMKHTNSNYY